MKVLMRHLAHICIQSFECRVRDDLNLRRSMTRLLYRKCIVGFNPHAAQICLLHIASNALGKLQPFAVDESCTMSSIPVESFGGQLDRIHLNRGCLATDLQDGSAISIRPQQV